MLKGLFELANKAYSLYVSQNSIEKAKLLKMLFSNCSVDAVSVTPTYRKSFDMIFERAQFEKWSALVDDFRTFQGTEVPLGSFCVLLDISAPKLPNYPFFRGLRFSGQAEP